MIKIDNFKSFLRTHLVILCLFFNFNNVLASTRTPMVYGTAYTDLYGPTQSNYSMGDFVRAVTDSKINLPAYQTMTDASKNSFTIPYASDIVSSSNALNLYNTLGYLYAGYAVFNVTPKTGINTFVWPENDSVWSDARCNQIAKHWIDYRNPAAALANNTPVYYPGITCNENANTACGTHPSLVELDNNIQCGNTLWLVNNPTYYTAIGWGTQGTLGQGAQTNPIDATGGCAWGTNQTTNNYVLKFQGPAYAAPYGQFWGARLSHILGAVVNDVPSASGSTTGTGAAEPLMSSLGGIQSPAPQIAILTGNAANWTYTNKNGTVKSNAPAGSVTPSTAHFGTMQNFLSTDSLISSTATSTVKLAGDYLKYHILQAVKRLSSVCSYEMSSTNLIHMKSSNVGSITPYDQGVIVAIQNNTGDQLTINQISTSTSAAGTSTTSPNLIGALSAIGTSNHFLHTASLMPANTAAGTINPVSGNMIEIIDATVKPRAYVQVVSGAQLQGLVTSLNTVLNTVAGTTGDAFAYNQANGASSSYAPLGQYLLLTNFNTSSLSSSLATKNEMLMYRMQAVDISQFGGVPFTITLQINEKNSILYPSVVSIKQLKLQNTYDQNRSSGGNTFYCGIPPLLISDSIVNSGISGIKAHYGIWFLSYISALTEFMYTGDFGDRLGYMQNTIGIFDLADQQPPARVVIDASGNLASGVVQTIITDTSVTFQSQGSYMSLMGCDVVDIGSDYHRDIPILNLYKDKTLGSVVANTQGGKWINFSVTFGQPAAVSEPLTTFAEGYGIPYNNVMLFSLPAADMTDGVIGELSQTSPGNYELTFTDQNSNVLAVQKVFLDASIQNPTSMNIQFLNSADADWNSFATVKQAVALGRTKQFELTYGVSGTKNTLKAIVYSAPKVVTKSKSMTVKKTKISGVLPATLPVTMLAASPATKMMVSPTTSSVTSTVTTDEIKVLKKQIQSFEAQVKKTAKKAIDKFELDYLNDIKNRTKELLKEVKLGMSAEEFAKIQKKYTNLTNEFSEITSPS